MASTSPTKIGRNLIGNRWGLTLISLFTTFFLIYLFIPPVWKLTEGPIKITRWPKTGEQVFVVGPATEHWVKVTSVSRHVINAIIVAEDNRFYNHPGVDFIAIKKSIEKNIAERRFARGGSTITQQVVKMTLLSPEKTLLRKTREAVGSLLLERILDKSQILEWYINLAEFGDGVFGIKAAAEHYFDTSPELLTIQHGAHLALVLPSPNGWSVGLRKRELTEFGHKRYKKIIDQLLSQRFITQALYESALATGDFGRPIKEHANPFSSKNVNKEISKNSPTN